MSTSVDTGATDPRGEDPLADAAAYAQAATDDRALALLAERIVALGGRALLIGAAGTGKSTLASRLGRALSGLGATPRCLGADPGTPAFGVPGAICLGEWRDAGWALIGTEALCSLDAGRFRLPLIECVRRLQGCTHGQPLILDGPGVVRGVAGQELLSALVAAADIGVVVPLARDAERMPLADAVRALGLPVLPVMIADAARRPGKSARARMRTRLWDLHLDGAAIHTVEVGTLPLLGTPPPLVAASRWRGRQIALVSSDGHTVSIGEVDALTRDAIRVRSHVPPTVGMSLLVRDARREANDLLVTAGPDAADAVRYVAPADVLPGVASATGPRPVVRAGPLTAALVNGVLGDPLLHVRIHHRRRSLLFDLGEAGRLPTRLAHQVSDVFLSHAHIDHIAGFLWLLRSRMGDLPPLRVFGPPGIAEHLRGLLAGILWDRIETRGPRFEVGELHDDRLERQLLIAGDVCTALDSQPAPEGCLIDEPSLRVHATPLDHGHGTRVLAFALRTPRSLNVRKERLLASGLVAGPWLTELKDAVAAGAMQSSVRLPDGSDARVERLAEELLIVTPGIGLGYATDLADCEDNQARLAALVHGVHTLFCEASFRLEDAAQAERTGHLTTRACGQIATRAGVERLVPFHFSRRYEHALTACYDEVSAVFGRTITPTLRDSGD